jgi:hypothetical protein
MVSRYNKRVKKNLTKVTQMPDKDFPISIFIPGLNDYVEVVGAICQVIDGKQYLRIVCRTSNGKETLLSSILSSFKRSF